MIIEKKRNGYVDFVKGVTIFLVVFSHTEAGLIILLVSFTGTTRS